MGALSTLMKAKLRALFSNIHPNVIARAAAGEEGRREFWRIRNRAEGSIDLEIMDEIGYWKNSASGFRQLVKGLDEKTTINLHIFSPGGSVFQGNEIANCLMEHKGTVNVTLGSLCASIATVIALA